LLEAKLNPRGQGQNIKSDSTRELTAANDALVIKTEWPGRS